MKPIMDRPVWKDAEGFLRGCDQFPMDWYKPTQKIGDIIGLSALYDDKKADLVGAAADFMLNVGFPRVDSVGLHRRGCIRSPHGRPGRYPCRGEYLGRTACVWRRR